MSAGIRDIIIEQGATFEMVLTIKSEDVPLDISDWEFAGQVREAFNSAEAAADFVFEIQDQNVEETKGQVLVLISNENTSAIPANDLKTKYLYDIEVDTGTSVKRLLQGKVTLNAEMTKE